MNIAGRTPFLKWAGGKRWFVKNYSQLFPNYINTYFEPFLGSGAVFFHLQPANAHLSDANSDLIDAYIGVQRYPGEVYSLLESHHRRHSKDFYYQMRSCKPDSLVEKAAWFIYLNRTCWNGLYRVNLDGIFNVPKGTKDSVIFESDDFQVTSGLLKNATLEAADFEDSIGLAREGDFIFADPPYTIKHNYNGFVKYNETLFSWDDQLRLKRSLDQAFERGANVLLTNANHDSVRELYSSHELVELSRSSTIAASGDKRGKYSELLIRMSG